MMLNNLIEEVRNRRVLALAALGVLVALALPLLFLKGAPDGAPAADAAAPAAASKAKLPARAARLLAATDAGSAGHASGSTEDPFKPPASYRAAVAAAAQGPTSGGAKSSAASATAGGASSSTTPIPVVVKNPGSTTSGTTKPSTTSGTTSGSTTRATPSRRLTARNAAVDIRFGPKADTPIKRAIARRKALYIHGKLVAMFVKYSPSRSAVVFALAPGLHVTGDVKCRVVDGSCRYIDIPAGEHVWLTYITPNRTIVNRRLDVVRVKRRSAGSSTTATSASARGHSACLMNKLVGMHRGDALLDRDACKS
jgi:hypothetical protein